MHHQFDNSKLKTIAVPCFKSTTHFSYVCILILKQMRSSRNFCIDIILLVIILGIAAYLYK
jgi:hypothetical protein